jgi:hypothetical protein
MTWTPNRIQLISHGRYDEAVASADVYPGMSLGQNSTLQVAGALTEGSSGPLLVALEDALQGGDITQKIKSGSIVPMVHPARGDLLLMLLQAGSISTVGGALMNAGDGTLIPVTSGGTTNTLYEITAPSTGVTNVSVETVFSNGSYTIPANFLLAGDVLHIHGRVVVSAQNSTNTHDVKLELGSSHTVLFDSGALALAANQYVIFDLYLTVRTIGASGTYVGDGTSENNPGGTVAELPISIASATFDTTVAELLRVTVTPSAASAGNVVALQELEIDLLRAGGGLHSIGFAQEVIDNTGSTGTSGFNSAAFIRVLIP